MSGAGLSTWKETATDFPAGQNIHTKTQNNSLSLDTNLGYLNNWTKLTDGYSPPLRCVHSMVYDPANGVHILFGGDWSGSARDNDTWTYNMSQNAWTEHSPKTVPDVLSEAAMAFDTQKGAAVMFGGMAGTYELAGTWTYNLAQETWTNMNPLKAPPARALHSMAYDPVSGRIVLSGGRQFQSGSQYEYFNDTWTYDLATNTWTDRTSGTEPSPRFGQPMCYDPASGQIVLFGGMYRHDFYYYNDTWTYDPASNIWTERHPANSPSPREGAVLAADVPGGTVVLYGGENGSACFNETWSYNVTNNDWTNLHTAGAPEPRYYSAMTNDQSCGQMLLFGGRDDQVVCYDDFWTYDPANNSWTKQGERTFPRPRDDFSMAFDSTNNLGVIYGGSSASNACNDTWTFDGSANLWNRKFPAVSPGYRTGAAMCYDRDAGVMILIGGESYAPVSQGTWTYDVLENTWVNLQPIISPPEGRGYAMAYDTDKHMAVLFGTGDSSNGTWTYDLTSNTWSDRTKSMAPSTRYGTKMVYDESARRMVLFGGWWNGPNFMNDTWLLDTNTFNWTRVSPAVSPSPRFLHSMAYDSSREVTLLFGGWGGNVFGDTWAYDAATNSWVNLTPAASPSIRGGAGMYYDSNMQMMVLFGGGTGQQCRKGDTWFYRFNGSTTSGTYTSAPKDTGGNAYFGDLQWDASTPAGTDVKLQLRAGASLADLEAKQFIGPDGTAGSRFNLSGQRIPSIHNGSRWVQYRANLTTKGLLATPLLFSVTVNYNILQNIAVMSPTGSDDWSGLQNITWSASDRDNDPLAFDIRLENDTANVLLAADFGTDVRQWTWNTATIPNGTYRIHITARDDNPSIPLSIDAMSGNFTIHHPVLPPPNRPPHVTLVSPLNNSYSTTGSARFQWIGTDPDGDSLNYSVRHSDRPLSEGNVLTDNTTAEYIDLAGLADNTTYYWTVDASDGKSNATDVPAEIWRFTILMPPANIPVRFTSTPPTIAWVGKEYAYNLTSVDEDGDIPVFSIVSGPPGLTIDASTGKLRWTPASTDIGNHTVTVQVSDGRGSTDNQTFEVMVLVPIRITSTPPVLAWVGQEYAYNLSWIGGESGIPVFSTLSGPVNLTIDASTGKVRWTPTSSDVGNHTVTVQVSESRGSTDSQTFTIQVLEIPVPPIAPTCIISSPANNSKVSGRVLVRGTALNGTLPLTIVRVRIDNGAWQTAVGLDEWTFTINTAKLAKGNHRIEARAFDANLSSDIVSVDIIVYNPEPAVSTAGNPWCLPAIIIAVVAGLSVLLLLRKRKGEPGSR